MTLLVGDALRHRGQRHRRRRGLRHRLMRHFRRGRLGLTIAVPGLPYRMQATRAKLPAVPLAGASNRVSSLRWRACGAEALPAVATGADPELGVTPAARCEPINLRRQPDPMRRFLDMELRI